MDRVKFEVDPVAKEQARKRLFEAVAGVSARPKVRPRAASWTIAVLSLSLILVGWKYVGELRARLSNAREIAELRDQTQALRESETLLRVQLRAPVHPAVSGSGEQALQQRTATAERTIAQGRREIGALEGQMGDLRAQIQSIQTSLDMRTRERDRAIIDRETLSLKLIASSNELVKLQQDIAEVQRSRSEDSHRMAMLQARATDLQNMLGDKSRDLEEAKDLLGNDRDIRDLMSARNLHIIDVHDTDFTGRTKKPFGRVFYTEGKSLIFYAYDLDKHSGPKRNETFQAWGFREGNRERATKLGLFYLDNANQHSWVLKFDDPKALEAIDSVFVTIEPPGGSDRPSGKSLLFAYLTGTPNHP